MKIERMENLRKGIRDALHSPQRTQRICILSGLCGNCFFIIAKGKKEVNSDCRLQIADFRLEIGEWVVRKSKGRKGCGPIRLLAGLGSPDQGVFSFGAYTRLIGWHLSQA